MPCSNCGKLLSPRKINCPVCAFDNGAPNIRQAEESIEKSALALRVAAARNHCSAYKLDAELLMLEDAGAKSRAVMTRSFTDLISLLSTNLNFYVGFAIQVDSDMRLPRPSSLDDVRRQWENAIMPNYADKILFASLSVAERGLRNYGGADIVLQDFALENRASVFDSNGLDFGRRHRLNETVPHGFRAKWRDRAAVVIAKLYGKLSQGIKFHHIDNLLQVDAGPSGDDDFVEVHVFEGVNHDAFEKVLANPRTQIEKQGWELAMTHAQNAGIPTVTRP